MSAKGTTWEKHKYVKVEDGKYYYPDGYEGGRHVGSDKETVESNEPKGWEDSLYTEFERNLAKNGALLDPKSVQQLLLFGKDNSGKGYDNFAIALSKAGIDTSKIDQNSLNLMRYKVLEHYKKEFNEEKENFDESGKRTGDRTADQESRIQKANSGKSESSSEKTESKSSSKKSGSSGSSSKSGGGSSKKSSSEKKSSEKDDEEKEEDKKKTVKKVIKNAYKAKGKVHYVTAKPKIVHGIIDPVYVIRPTGLKWNIL